MTTDCCEFKLEVIEGKDDQFVMHLCNNEGETICCFPVNENTISILHKDVFLPTIGAMENGNKGGKLQKLRHKCKQKFQPNRFPLLPSKPLLNDTNTQESYRRKLEDYFNLILLEFGCLLMDENFGKVLGVHEIVQDTIANYVMDSTFHNYFSSHPDQEEIDSEVPNDPTKTCANIGWLLQLERERRSVEPYEDRTNVFEMFLDDLNGTEAWKLPDNVKDRFVLLFVPGLFSGAYKHFVGYFKDNMRPFECQGVATHLLRVNSFSSVHKNSICVAEKVKDLLNQEEHKLKQVILVGHSKGGVDCVTALSLTENGLLASGAVAGVICIQSPFSGSPFAKKIGFAQKLQGVRAVNDLNHVERKSFLDLHPFSPKECGIPVVCVVSEMTVPKGVLRNNIKRLQAKSGVNCDGLVVPEDAIIPDSFVVKIKDIDHANTVFHRLRMGNPNERYRPARLTLAAFRLLLESMSITGTVKP